MSQRGRTLTTSYKLDSTDVEISKMKVDVLKDGVKTSNIHIDTDYDAKVLQVSGQQRVSGVYNVSLVPVLENGNELNAMELTVYAEDGTTITAKTKGTLDAMKLLNKR